MVNIGDIVPYYLDWDSPNPQIIEGYGKLIEIIDEDPLLRDRIYEEMPENKQKIYYIETWIIQTGNTKTKKLILGEYKYVIEPIIIRRKVSILKQIGIHKKTDAEQNDKKINPYRFQEGSIAKKRNIVDKIITVERLTKEDMQNIHDMTRNQIEYRPILLVKEYRDLVNNEEFSFNSSMNLTFKTINCKEDGDSCPIKYKPKYLHEVQSLYYVLTSENLKLNLDEIRKTAIKLHKSPNYNIV